MTQPDSIITNICSEQVRIDALVERELQQQELLRSRMLRLRAQQQAAQRRRQTAIVTSLVNIGSVAALLAVALIWQFYFPVAAAVAALIP